MSELVVVGPAPDPRPSGAPRPRRRGRLALVVATVGIVLGVGGAVEVPRLRRARMIANESAVIATLKNISSGQSQCQASGCIDRNRNEAGEYGWFGELSGGHPMRGGGPRITPPMLPEAFGSVSASRVERGGYLFQMFLPGRERHAVVEDANGGDAADDNGVDAVAAETLWSCYAWPIARGSTGVRAFFVNQSGDLLTTNGSARGYDGAATPCMPDAAHIGDGDGSMASPMAANTVGRDGNFWVVV